MGCPQLGQACSSILADDATMDALPSSGEDEPLALLQPRETLGFALARGLDLGGFTGPDDRFGGGDGQTPNAKIPHS